MIDRKSISEHYEKNNVIVATTAILLLAVAIAPMFLHEIFDSTHINHPILGMTALTTLPIIAIWFCYRLKLNLSTRGKVALFSFIAGFSVLLVDIHSLYIDESGNYSSHFFSTVGSNNSWQMVLHKCIMGLNIESLPHLYRFLPNSILSYFLLLTDDFEFSRYLFRVIFMILMLYAIYYYSSLYYRHETAILTMMIYAAIYQISIRFYAGQITDPVSHLCFILSFIFLELDLFIYFALAVLIGSLAKETIVIMAVYYLLKCLRSRANLMRATLLLLIILVVIIGIRLYISQVLQYTSISGVGPEHILDNLCKIDLWGRQLLFTVGIFIPFFLASYKSSAREIRTLVLYLTPTLILSNIVFGWLHEARNLIPVVIPMALMTANFLINGNANEASDK